jgi:hypothetical protein
MALSRPMEADMVMTVMTMVALGSAFLFFFQLAFTVSKQPSWAFVLAASSARVLLSLLFRR